ncbi:hypothetical protein CANTEDRAFT_113332 [Yamadazyma tenuis ATCC 10573]|uniref:protein disulfide-isomerase n=2 Tax=Candida tenuis TaxID=2315449 RepID=G3B1Z5_CANTC|nr:thioredoxin-like protein [Yamadazyma tenuis ATCC 10573]XP_006685834.1 uncharacterized protein CANTEDRAFT_113332 [Yamadazyma tenuis ATCC 10573]EGV65027.1 thioredoxin-like protein [Yamadazyma tenuis ATCC 10573]EGV65028.1 hypothetical protein CANTEDRAFT_113332 [Yamadazyma tenuis ATCC 10573]
MAVALGLDRVNDYNFDKVVRKSGDWVLVDFYADWCRHCQNLMPTIEKLASAYEKVPGVNVVKLNGGERSGRKSVLKYNVDGFPALGLYHNEDDPIFYEGSRDFESINNFIKLATGVNEVDSPQIEASVGPQDMLSINDHNIRELVLDSSEPTVVLVTGEWCRQCKEFKPIFNQVATEFETNPEVKFGVVDLDNKHHTTDKLRAQFGIETIPAIFYFDPTRVDSDGLKRPVKYEGNRNLSELVKFINSQLPDATNSITGRNLTLESQISAIRSQAQAVKLLESLESLDPSDFATSYYSKIFHKLTYKQHLHDKAPDVASEITRLSNLLQTSGHLIHPQKKKQLITRLNILRFYQSTGLNF